MSKKLFIFLVFFSVICAYKSHSQTVITDTAALRYRINADVQPNTQGAVTAYRMNYLLNGILNVIQRYKADSVWIFAGHLKYKRFDTTYDLGSITSGCDTCFSLQPLTFDDSDFVSPTSAYDGLNPKNVKINENKYALKTDITSDSTASAFKVDTIAPYPKCSPTGTSYIIDKNPPAKYWCSPDSLSNPFFGKQDQVAFNIGGTWNYHIQFVGEQVDVTNDKTAGTYKYFPDSTWDILQKPDLNIGNNDNYPTKYGTRNFKKAYIIAHNNIIIEVHPDSSVYINSLDNPFDMPVHLSVNSAHKLIVVPDTALTGIDPIQIDNITGAIKIRQSLLDSIRAGNFGGVWGHITGTLSAQTDLQTALNAKLNISDTAGMLSHYLRSNIAAATYVPYTGGSFPSGAITDSILTERNSDGTVRKVPLSLIQNVTLEQAMTNQGSTAFSSDHTIVLGGHNLKWQTGGVTEYLQFNSDGTISYVNNGSITASFGYIALTLGPDGSASSLYFTNGGTRLAKVATGIIGVGRGTLDATSGGLQTQAVNLGNVPTFGAGKQFAVYGSEQSYGSAGMQLNGGGGTNNLGNIDITSGSPNIVGHTTHFLSTLNVNDSLIVNIGTSAQVYKILSITDDTHLTLTTNSTVTEVGGTDWYDKTLDGVPAFEVLYNLNTNIYRKLKLNAYGSGTNTGTATYNLSVDASGNLIETAIGGGGSGTVTSFSSGNLSPLFTTSVSTSTTTPALNFSLSNAAAHTFLGNNTGSSAAPAYSAINEADVTNLTTDLAAKQTSLTRTAVKTSSYTAAVNDLVPVNTTSGNVTITLPTAPADKARITVKHIIQGGTNTVTVATGGSDVFNKTGGSTTLTLSLLAQGVELQYDAANAIWTVLSDDLPLSQLDSRYLLTSNAAVVYNNQANTYTAGFPQTFTADATHVGLAFGGVTADPSSPVTGGVWYRSDLNKFRYYDGTTVRSLVSEALAQTLTNKTIAAGSNTITGITNSNLSGSAGITNANLANSAITINGTSTALGGSIDVRPTHFTLASDKTTTSTTMAGVSTFTLAVVAGVEYKLEILIKSACDNTGGVKLGLSITGSPTFNAGSIFGQNASTTGLRFGEITAVDGTTNVGNFNTVAANAAETLVCGFTAGTTGTVQLFFGSVTAGQTSTIRAGSEIFLTPVQ
jgi:hypothetical protein